MCHVIFSSTTGRGEKLNRHVFNEKVITKAEEKRSQCKQTLTSKELTA
jgi:hypothetical protein